MMMNLYQRLEEDLLPGGKAFISITGGGGKTTLLSGFGRYLASRGRSVLLTTTAKVASPYLHDYGVDRIYGDEGVLSHMPEKGSLVFYAEHHTMDMKKWIAPRPEVLSALYGRYDAVLSEADGSRGLPLKVHTERDPVIHPLTTSSIAVAGLWGIGGKAYSVSFGDGRGIPVDRDYLQWYIDAPAGLTKGFTGRCCIVFNGAENCGEEIIAMLSTLSYPEGIPVYAASEKEDRIYGIIR